MEQYRGVLTLPGEEEPRQFDVLLDQEEKKVTIRFETPVDGTMEWVGSSVQMVRRLKYQEIIFTTSGFPKGGVDLRWKINADLYNSTGAGVVVVRPNELRISGEKGFTLVKSSDG